MLVKDKLKNSMFSIIKKRKIWFTFSAALVITGIIVSLLWGLRLGIDFTGGSLLEIEFLTQRPTNTEIIEALQPLNLGGINIQQAGQQGIVLRFKDVNESTHQAISTQLKQTFGQGNPEDSIIEEKRFSSIGPTIGQELQRKTVWAIIIVLIAIIAYVAWAFRKVSKPIASWKYGLIAVIALFHDIIITIGIFVILGQVYGLEVNAPFIAALLTILGYSVNDTIVVFDRTRENLIRHIGKNFEEIVDESVNQVLTRSINASLTTILVLFSILLFGGQTIRDFVLALIIGIAVGTYSSIFLASPLLVTWEKFKFKK